MRQHGIHHRLGAIEHALQIDRNHPVELLIGHVFDLRVSNDTRVIHQTIDTTKLRQRGIDHRTQRFGIGDIRHRAQRLRTFVLAQLHSLGDSVGA